MAEARVGGGTVRLGFVRGDEFVGLGEPRTVADRGGAQDRGALENGLDPLGVLFEEERVAIRVEGSPHEGVVAEAEDEEVAGPDGLEGVEGDPDLGEGLLRDHARRGVVENGEELGRRRREIGGRSPPRRGKGA